MDVAYAGRAMSTQKGMFITVSPWSIGNWKGCFSNPITNTDRWNQEGNSDDKCGKYQVMPGL